jgi:hypothetical protein
VKHRRVVLEQKGECEWEAWGLSQPDGASNAAPSGVFLTAILTSTPTNLSGQRLLLTNIPREPGRDVKWKDRLPKRVQRS